MTKQQKHALLARRLRNKAARYLKYWEKTLDVTDDERDDAELLEEVIKKDYRDMLKAAKLLREGKVQKAAKMVVYDFDTNVREEIPNTVYDYLEKVYYGD